MSLFGAAGLLGTREDELTAQLPEMPSLFQSAGLIESDNPILNPMPVPGGVPTADEPRGILGKVFDFLSRGNYGSAKVFDTLLSMDPADGQSFPSVFYNALKAGAQEVINPQSRLTFSDVIRRNYPGLEENSGWTTAAIEGLGLVGDIALDPVTWLTFGYGSATKLGTAGKLLSKAGRSAFKSEIAQQLPKAAGDFAAAREVAEEVIGNMISAGKSEYLAKFKLFGVPVAKQGAIESAFKVFYEHGPKQAIDLARKVPGLKQGIEFAEWLPKAVNVKHQLPEEYMDARRTVVADWAKGGEKVKSTLRSLFLDYKDEEIDAVETLHQRVYDKTRRYYDDLYNTGLKTIGDADAAKIQALSDTRAASTGIWEQEFNASRLDPKLKVLSGAMRQEYQAVGKRLHEAGLIDDLIENYHPLIFDVMSDKAKLKEYFNYVKNPFLPAGQTRKIKTFEEAREWATKKGIDIETNAIKLYATRAIQAEKALAWTNFKSQVKGLGFDLDNLPKRIAEDMRFLGEGDFGAGLNDAARTGLKFWDRGLGAFRKVATTLKPAFAGKQAISNQIQSYLELGPKAFKYFDPRSRIDAFHILAHQSGYGDPQKFLTSKIVSTLGEPITGEQMIKELADFNVVRGTNIGSGGAERTAKTLKQEIDRERFIRRKFGKDYEGTAKLFYKASNYMSWPSIIEDFSRVNLYVNGRRAGLTAKEAAKKVDDALFDYVHGLSQLERRVARRVVPFYSFQRFMIPMLGETLLKEPGRLANVAKTSRDFMEVYGKLEGGEDLTQSERRVLPGWLLDQPFAKMDADRQAMFRVLSNFNPLDVMGMIEVDQGGDIDIRKSLVNASLSQLAPLIKAPFELLANKNFFTDRAIVGEKSSGRIGDVSPSGVFSNIVAAIGGNYAGLPGMAAGKLAGELLPDDVAKWVMDATGWEESFDPKTGKRQVYINPYLSYVASAQFPILAQAIRFDRYGEAQHPYERWLDLVAGVPTTRTNLMDNYRYGRRGDQREISKLKTEMRQAYASKRMDTYERARADLQELLLEFTEKYSQINTGDIRGF